MTSPTFTPCPECRIVGAHRFDCSRSPRTRAATPAQLQAASRPPGVPPDTASPRATCLFCGGRGTLHARGGAATGTCPLPPSGCGGSGTVDAATRAAQEAQRNAPSALAAFHSSPSSPLVEAARILDAGLARPPGTVAPTPPIASPALTVGAAIKVPHVAEYQHPEHPGRWFQAKAGNWHRWWRPDAIGGPSWSMWTVPILDSDLALPCRLVAAKDADLDPSTRAPLASPRPAEAERETRCALTCPHGDRCTLAPHDAATGCNHRVCPCNEPNEPGLWTTRAQVREAMHVAVPLTDEADADNLWSVLAAGDDLTKIPREPRRRRGQADPTRAIAAPGLDLAARVAALLAVADRATPGPLVLCDRCREQNGGRPFPGCAACWPRRPPAPQPADFDRGVDILRNAPGIIREQGEVIARLRGLAIEACDVADRIVDEMDEYGRVPPDKRIAAIREALTATEPTP